MRRHMRGVGLLLLRAHPFLGEAMPDMLMRMRMRTRCALTFTCTILTRNTYTYLHSRAQGRGGCKVRMPARMRV